MYFFERLGLRLGDGVRLFRYGECLFLARWRSGERVRRRRGGERVRDFFRLTGDFLCLKFGLEYLMGTRLNLSS